MAQVCNYLVSFSYFLPSFHVPSVSRLLWSLGLLPWLGGSKKAEWLQITHLAVYHLQSESSKVQTAIAMLRRLGRQMVFAPGIGW
jgi:hypothetical protein